MDFKNIDSILSQKGLSNEPALNNVGIAIQQLPDKYAKRGTLGLYYPDEGVIVIPPNADSDTLLHEVGHRVYHFYNNDLSERSANLFMHTLSGRAVRRVPVKSGTGTFAKIVGMQADAFHPSYDDVIAALIIQNNTESQIGIWGEITYEYGGNEYPVEYSNPTSGNIDPGMTLMVVGGFKMPGQEVRVNGYSSYFGIDGNWYQDGSKSISVTPESGDIPPDYRYACRIVYPEAATYLGEYEICTAKFVVPLTVIPGISGLIDMLIGKFITACAGNDITPLELRIFKKDEIPGSTSYYIQFVAHSNSAERVVKLEPVPFIIILSIIGITVIGTLTIIGITKLSDYNESAKLKNTTVTNDTNEMLNPNQSLSVSGPVIVTDKGGGDTKYTTPNGQTATISSGNQASVPANSTIVGGSKGANVFIPGGTSIIESPNPQGDVVGNITKALVIGAVVTVVTVGAIAAFQAFGKRDVYPTRK